MEGSRQSFVRCSTGIPSHIPSIPAYHATYRAHRLYRRHPCPGPQRRPQPLLSSNPISSHQPITSFTTLNSTRAGSCPGRHPTLSPVGPRCRPAQSPSTATRCAHTPTAQKSSMQWGDTRSEHPVQIPRSAADKAHPGSPGAHGSMGRGFGWG